MLKRFLSEAQKGLTPNTWWDHSFAGHNKEATLELKALHDGRAPFDTPKPSRLIRRILQIASDPDSIVGLVRRGGHPMSGAFGRGSVSLGVDRAVAGGGGQPGRAVVANPVFRDVVSVVMNLVYHVRLLRAGFAAAMLSGLACVTSPERHSVACTSDGEPRRVPFYAFFAPLNYSADETPHRRRFARIFGYAAPERANLQRKGD